MKLLLVALTVIAVAGAAPGGWKHGNWKHSSRRNSRPATKSQLPSIAAAAAATPSLSTLLAAVKAADLAGTLSGPGTFTVFAPNNDAFAKLPPGTVNTLLKPENKEQLTMVLLRHVLPAQIKS